MPSSLDAARAWLSKGRAVIPIPHRTKAPTLKNWTGLRLTPDTFGDYFNGEPHNIGLLLGEPSGGLVDVDLDCEEAAAVAPYLLPETFVYGRSKRPASHWLYEVPDAATRKWQFDGRMLLELRSTGCQSLIPPSVHPDGDHYRREPQSKPLAQLAAEDIVRALNRIASAALVAQHWPEKGRHELALTLAGALAHSGWGDEDIEIFVEVCAVAAKDEELADRLRAVKDTLKRRASGKAATGWPRLGELLPAEVVGAVRDWLDIEDFPALIVPRQAKKISELVTVCAADIEPRALEPLWDGVLWIGKPTLLVGDPGKGKSLVTLDIAARVTTGAPWPCSDEEREPASVMLLSAEDDADDTIVPRLEAAGADLSRVHIISGVRGAKGIDWLALDRHWQQLSDGMRFFEPRLLIIDPLSSYMGRADTNHEGESRKVLAGLAELAKQSRAAVLAIRHFRKGVSESAQGRVIGSVAFTAAARAVYGVVPDPEDEDYRLLVCIKCNLATDTDGYRFHVTETAVGNPLVAWDSTHDHRTAEELLGSGRKAAYDMTCEECRREFAAARRGTKFCSQACKQAAYRRRVTATSVSRNVTRQTTREGPSNSNHKYRNDTSQSVTVAQDSDSKLRDVTDTPTDVGTGTGSTVTRCVSSTTEKRNSAPTGRVKDSREKRNKESERQLPLADSTYRHTCLNCGGKGCRCCDEQLRDMHYGRKE